MMIGRYHDAGAYLRGCWQDCVTPLRVAGVAFFLIVFTAGGVRAEEQAVKEPLRITYVSVEAFYLNAGRLWGLGVGDTLSVSRGSTRLGYAIVATVASHSALCRPLNGGMKVAVGDDVKVKGKATRISTAITAGRGGTDQTRKDRMQLRGYLSYLHSWQRDLTDAELTWLQPSIHLNLRARRIQGKNITFRLRHKSLANKRSSSLETQLGEKQWIHRVSEASLVFGDSESAYEVGVGRVLVQQMGGIGYTDGIYTAVRLNKRYHVGGMLGTVPNLADGSFRNDYRRAGFFLSREVGSYDASRLVTTVALSSSSAEGTVDREFLYLQNRYSYRAHVSLYQSVELDYNRDWRMEAAGERISFSNLYLTANANVGTRVAFDASFDARKNVWTHAVISTPDSLFDSALSRGVDGGVALNLPARIRLRGHLGRRFGRDGISDIDFRSGSVTRRGNITRGDFFSFRYSRSKSSTTTGTQPAASYQFPFHGLRLTSAWGGYVYRTGDVANASYYYDLGAHASVRRNYFLSGTWRYYFSGPLKSVQIVAEAGWSF